MVIDYSKVLVDRSLPLDIGHVVWVRLDGYPWWPAVVVNRKEREPEVELDAGETLLPESNSNRMVEFFYDEGRVAVADVNNICEYTANIKLVRQSGKPRKDVISACREANTYIEKKGTEVQRNRYSKLQPFEDYIRPRSKQSKNGPGSSADVSMDGHDEDDEDGRSEMPPKRKSKSKKKSESAKNPVVSGTESLPRRRSSDIPGKSKKRVDKYEPGLVNAKKEERLTKSVPRRSREHSNDDLNAKRSPLRKHVSGLSPNLRLVSSHVQSTSHGYNADTGQSAYRNRDIEHGFETGSQTRRPNSDLSSQMKKNRHDSDKTSWRQDSEVRLDVERDNMTEKPPRKRHKSKNTRWSDGGERETIKREPHEEKLAKHNADSGKRPRTVDNSDTDSDDSTPERLPRRDNNTIPEADGEEDISDSEVEFETGPVDTALATNNTPEDVAGEFNCDVVDESDARPDSTTPSRKELLAQFERFQIALIQYHDDLLEVEYLRKLELSKLEEAKKKRHILLTETQKLKKVSVSRDTLADTGVLERLTPFVKTLKKRTPRLVEDMNSLAKRWASYNRVEKFRSKPAPNAEGKTEPIATESRRDKKSEWKTEEHEEEFSNMDVEKNLSGTISSPKPDNSVGKVEPEEINVEEEIWCGNVGNVKKDIRKEANDLLGSTKEKPNESIDIPQTDDVVPTAVESMKESRIAERAKQFNPQTNLKALGVLIKNSGRSPEEVERMTELVEKEIRDRAEDEADYYSLSVRTIKALKKKTNLEKLCDTKRAAHLFVSI